MNVHELNTKYFEYYGDLFEAKPLLPEIQYEASKMSLYNDFCREAEIVVGERELEIGQYVFELRFKLRNYLPRRRFLRWNKFAKKMLKRLKAEFLAEIAVMEKETNEIKEETKEIQTSERDEKQPEETTALTVQNVELPEVSNK